MSEYISIKEYARINKISIFNAIKLARSGKIESITKEENGKEVIYIKNEKLKVKEEKPKELSLEDEVKELKAKVAELEERLSKLENINKIR